MSYSKQLARELGLWTVNETFCNCSPFIIGESVKDSLGVPSPDCWSVGLSNLGVVGLEIILQLSRNPCTNEMEEARDVKSNHGHRGRECEERRGKRPMQYSSQGGRTLKVRFSRRLPGRRSRLGESWKQGGLGPNKEEVAEEAGVARADGSSTLGGVPIILRSFTWESNTTSGDAMARL
jgi:hypothetical protein